MLLTAAASMTLGSTAVGFLAGGLPAVNYGSMHMRHKSARVPCCVIAGRQAAPDISFAKTGISLMHICVKAVASSGLLMSSRQSMKLDMASHSGLCAIQPLPGEHLVFPCLSLDNRINERRGYASALSLQHSTNTNRQTPPLLAGACIHVRASDLRV